MSRATLMIVLLCGLAAVSRYAVAAEKRLDSSAIRELVLGREIAIATRARKSERLRLEPGGEVRGAGARSNRAERWSIRDDALCLDIAVTAEPRCMSVIEHDEDAKRLFLFTKAGEPFGEILLGGAR